MKAKMQVKIKFIAISKGVPFLKEVIKQYNYYKDYTIFQKWWIIKSLILQRLYIVL